MWLWVKMKATIGFSPRCLRANSNAADAVSEEDGEILLETRYQQGIRLKVPGGGTRIDLPLVVSVQDNGPGIPEELRHHLFDPFVTTKEAGRGSGLGLVVAHGIAVDHGGDIEVESEPGEGAVFRVYLPQVAAPAVEEEPGPAPEPGTRPSTPRRHA